jgi:hypothetical protein
MLSKIWLSIFIFGKNIWKAFPIFSPLDFKLQNNLDLTYERLRIKSHVNSNLKCILKCIFSHFLILCPWLASKKGFNIKWQHIFHLMLLWPKRRGSRNRTTHSVSSVDLGVNTFRLDPSLTDSSTSPDLNLASYSPWSSTTQRLTDTTTQQSNSTLFLS